jgi:hypothetical protein
MPFFYTRLTCVMHVMNDLLFFIMVHSEYLRPGLMESRFNLAFDAGLPFVPTTQRS